MDRDEDQSVVDEGPFSGSTLGELWDNHRSEIFGAGFESFDRFPLLIKILDARADLSIQVHPPDPVARRLGGESKTEMWYVAQSDEQAKLYVGLKSGTTRNQFEQGITEGSVVALIHELSPVAGESIFIPSGRLHAIGAGFLIHEIQQNSDTTYRVFDWNRLGLDGLPRELHIAQSLASIDFADFEPDMTPTDMDQLAHCEHFSVRRFQIEFGQTITRPCDDRFAILSLVEGQLESNGGRRFLKGQTILLARDGAPLTALEDCVVLQITIPEID